MAQAQIRCKCKICSKEFWHKHNCANRSEAERYEEWAAENVTVCPECYKEQQQEAAIAKEEKYCNRVEMPYYKYKNEYFDCKVVPNSYDKGSKTITVFIPTAAEKAAQKMTEAMPFPSIREARIAYAISEKYGIDYKIPIKIISAGKEKIAQDLAKKKSQGLTSELVNMQIRIVEDILSMMNKED